MLLPIPFTAGLRYLLPIFPLFCFATIEGTFWFWEKMIEKFKFAFSRLLPAFIWLAFFLFLLYSDNRLFNKEAYIDLTNGPYAPATQQVVFLSGQSF